MNVSSFDVSSIAMESLLNLELQICFTNQRSRLRFGSF